MVKAPALADLARHAGEAARLLRALASPHRLQVLCALVGGEQSVSALHRRVLLSQSALSQHLAVLRAEGLVATRREGQTIYYALPAGAALHVILALHEVYCGPGPRPLTRKRKKTT